MQNHHHSQDSEGILHFISSRRPLGNSFSPLSFPANTAVFYHCDLVDIFLILMEIELHKMYSFFLVSLLAFKQPFIFYPLLPLSEILDVGWFCFPTAHLRSASTCPTTAFQLSIPPHPPEKLLREAVNSCISVVNVNSAQSMPGSCLVFTPSHCCSLLSCSLHPCGFVPLKPL